MGMSCRLWDPQHRQAAFQHAADQRCHDALQPISGSVLCSSQSCPTHFDPCVSSLPARALPAMLHTMKQAKMKPCGRCSPWGDSAGVHRKTKVYMEPSKRLCIAPSSAILGSAGSNGGWSQTSLGMLCMHAEVRGVIWWQHGGLELGYARQALLYTQKLLQAEGTWLQCGEGGAAEACQGKPASGWRLSDDGSW